MADAFENFLSFFAYATEPDLTAVVVIPFIFGDCIAPVKVFSADVIADTSSAR